MDISLPHEGAERPAFAHFIPVSAAYEEIYPDRKAQIESSYNTAMIYAVKTSGILRYD